MPTNLRNLIGDLALDESLTSREVINTKLPQILDDATAILGSIDGINELLKEKTARKEMQTKNE